MDPVAEASLGLPLGIAVAGATLFWQMVIGAALLMEAANMSMVLGAFIAGMLLADSEYRHELEANIGQFKGLLLGLFFIAVGASIDFALIASQPLLIAALVIALVMLKFAVLLGLTRIFGMGTDQGLLLAFIEHAQPAERRLRAGGHPFAYLEAADQGRGACRHYRRRGHGPLLDLRAGAGGGVQYPYRCQSAVFQLWIMDRHHRARG